MEFKDILRFATLHYKLLILGVILGDWQVCWLPICRRPHTKPHPKFSSAEQNQIKGRILDI